MLTAQKTKTFLRTFKGRNKNSLKVDYISESSTAVQRNKSLAGWIYAELAGIIASLRERLICYIESENKAEVNPNISEDMINSLKSKDIQEELFRLGHT